jgi:AcrR family transcriptional regulator
MMESATKTLRADARRNRDKLLAAALTLFTEQGTDVPLEAVARQAGVGVGTLYRHFPTRDALVEAVYLQELDRLHEGAAELLAGHAPDEALALWMDLFVQYAATKKGLSGAMQSVIASGGNPYSQSRAKMVEALSLLLDAARAEGTVRDDLDAEDVLLAMGGIWTLPVEPGWEQRARKLLGLVMDGLRHGA